MYIASLYPVIPEEAGSHNKTGYMVRLDYPCAARSRGGGGGTCAPAGGGGGGWSVV